ncbi:PTS system beta-glucoside-specific IIA component, Glc family /PTS system beta-glucoside-specific IIB component, Glc family /PTS system beta-glucoside-specific IIC component, Glc family /PTS system IIA component, Glc family /PTS system IIB component, Glc family /PTS system IIC component, Glc family [Izhakiella capsodis]|uniref:PTS system glucose-specific EIIA component n=1 Tax=Izhakiella capsodis TaxID=1367852 RepID=A0A1I4XH33_9GAMM|nr:beta-glucoside-specific PTS transporter subunit IIABC [Izhakiella capsodis]SFN24803.1 PTS system beta-glucoside-specific IIA component, Glc family /PTS system beta-glucoside-specific IIB component, Glc family /PTS system beta-glucoside-specific IIC component, Glc family /PTS system IIA component, Glc family /PTS system IIB component, Glc family /PTS system IIC component, Glc family [Izhakiella capsodis]
MNAKQLAGSVLALVGSTPNIITAMHCATRLRLTLKDTSLVQDSEINALDGVISTVNSGGQFQIIIGNRVSEVYKELALLIGESTVENAQDAPAQRQPVVSRFIDVVSSIFTPLMGAMAAAGILKGLLTITLATGWLTKTDDSWRIMWAASDGLFYFLPILLAATAAKKFQCNVYVAMSIAAALVYPDMLTLALPGETVSFFGLPVVVVRYTSSVIPIIITVWVMSLLEFRLNRWIHETVRNVLTPFILLCIMVPLTLATIGPVSTLASEMLAAIFVSIYQFSPAISSGLFAACWQVLVIFGIHWGFAALFMNDIAVTGRSYLKAATAPAIFSQAGAILAVMLKTRDPKLKTLSASAFISALFGITEPGVYGVTLKLKRPFICATVAAAIGGMVVGWAHSSALSMGITGLLTLPIYYGHGFGGFLVGCAIAFVLAALFTWFFGVIEELPTGEQKAPVDTQPAVATPAAPGSSYAHAEQIRMPFPGNIVPLQSVSDRVFSSGIVGRGCAVIPALGELHAPVDGVVSSVFDTGHAISLLSHQGAELLIHVGIDTVQLAGTCFIVMVKAGDTVCQGDLLLRFDIAGIIAAGLDITTPVVITNSDDYAEITLSPQTVGQTGDLLMTLNK